MRISSHQAQQGAINAMLEQQEKLARVQKQVATGQKIFRPSEDPVAAAKIVKLHDILGTNKQFQDNIAAARARLNLEEGVLDNVTGVLQRVRELAVLANNDTQTNESRASIAEEVEQLRDELVGLANSMDSTGEFLFAGSRSRFRPFTRNENGEYDYHGDDAQRYLQIGPRRQIATSDSGTTVFRDIRDGNGDFTVLDHPDNRGSGIADPGNIVGQYDQGTYAIVFETYDPAAHGGSGDPYLSYSVIDAQGNVIRPAGTPYASKAAIQFAGVVTSIEGQPEPGDFFVIRPSYRQDMFTTVQQLAEALRIPRGDEVSRAKLHNEVNRVIAGLDQALGNVLDVRASVGARLNALDGQESINEGYSLQVREILSDVEDLDYAKAVSELNLKLTGLEASQKAFTRVQGISLFNYI